MESTISIISEAQREELTDLIRGKLAFNVPMSRHTTFGVGGPADAWVEPADVSELQALLSYCGVREFPTFFLGNGTNLLVRDRGVRGVVIRLSQPSFRKVSIDGTQVTAGSGISNARLLECLREAQLGGMEFLCGIPGCVGGGVAMNAGAHGKCFADFIREVKILDPSGAIRMLNREEMHFEYRHFRDLRDSILLQATFSLKVVPKGKIQKRIEDLLAMRNATQPKGSGPGCVFKNPKGQSAGKIIDGLGLKDLRLGGAWVSSVHANFILNDKKATSADILALIETVREQVHDRTGITLETEIKIIGDA